MHSRLFIRCKYIYLHCILSYLPCIIIALKFVYVLVLESVLGFFIYCNSYDYMLYGKASTEMCPVLIYKLVYYLNGMEKERGCKMGCPYSSLKLWCLFSLSLFGFIFSDSNSIQRERNLLFCINCKVYIHVHNVILYNHFFHVSTIYFTLYLQL